MQNTDPVTAFVACNGHQMAALVHLSGIFTLFVGPLVIYLARGATTDAIREAAREALNFQLMLLMAWIATFVSFVILVGFLIAPVLALVSIALPVWAAVASSRGENFRYPLIPRLLR